ncbi:MAG: TonB-dependent siderophore receptor [Puniceicoccaceae bacterium]
MLLAVPLCAQEDNGSIFELEAFEVSSTQSGYYSTNSLSAYRVNTPVKDLPFNMEIFTAEFVDDIKANDLEDVLYWAAGVNVAGGGNSRDVGSDNYTIRGLRASRPKRNGFTRYYILDSTNIAQVEVVKGPVSALFGTSEPGGIINYITKKPLEEFNGSVKLDYGSWDYRKGQLEVTGPLLESKKVLYRLDAAYLNRNGYRDFNDEKRSFFAPVIEFRPFDDWMVRVDYEYSKSDITPLSPLAIWNPEAYERWLADGSPVGDREVPQQSYALPRDETLSYRYFTDIADERVSLKSNTAGPDAYMITESDAWTVEMTGKMTDWLHLRAVASEASTNRVSRNSSPHRLRVMGDATQRNPGVFGGLENSTAHFQVDAVINFDLFKVEHRFIVGTEFLEDDFINRSNNIGGPHLLFLREDSRQFVDLKPPESMEPVFREYPLRDLPADDDPNWKSIETNEELESYYISYQAKAWNGRIHLLTGIRHDKNTAIGSGAGAANFEITNNSPQAGLNVEFIEGFTAYANYSESFVPQTGGMLGLNNEMTDTEQLGSRPPQLGEGYEAGLKWQARDNQWIGTLAWFDISRNNVIQKAIFVPTTGPFEGVPLTYDRLIDGQTSSGFEFDLTWNPSAEMQFRLGYAYIDATSNDENFSDLPHEDYLRSVIGVPENELTFMGSYRFTEGWLEGLKVGLSASYKDKRSGNDRTQITDPRRGSPATLNDINVIWLDAYLRVDLLVTYKTKYRDFDTEFSLRLENVFDKTYFLPGPHLGNPFNIKAGLKVSF